MIERLLDKHNIKYIAKGSDLVIKCLNEDHDDEEPSMRINKLSGMFHCFSCEFKGGLTKLYKLLGESEPSQSLKLQVKISMLKDKLATVDIINIILPKDRKLVKEFRNLKEETLKDHDTFIVSDSCNYPELIGRVCIPIYYNNRVQFIEARALTDSGVKYLRYPENSNTNFILSENCGAPLLVLVEGIFDYLRLYDLGLRNVTPLFGLSFKNSKAQHILEEGFIGVISMLDNDTAGKAASTRIEKTCKYNGLVYKNFRCPTDPGDITEDIWLSLVKRNNCTIHGDYLL